MLFLLLALGILLVLVAVFTLFRKKELDEEQGPTTIIDPNCCGAHEVCDKEFENFSNLNEMYFDDDELDRFINSEHALYSDNEVEEFREVLYTLKRNEISTWLSSLEFRKITAPSIIKDEALLLLQD